MVAQTGKPHFMRSENKWVRVAEPPITINISNKGVIMGGGGGGGAASGQAYW